MYKTDAELLNHINNQPELNRGNCWLVNVVYHNGDVYQTQTFLYLIDAAVATIRNNVDAGDTIREIVVC